MNRHAYSFDSHAAVSGYAISQGFPHLDDGLLNAPMTPVAHSAGELLTASTNVPHDAEPKSSGRRAGARAVLANPKADEAIFIPADH